MLHIGPSAVNTVVDSLSIEVEKQSKSLQQVGQEAWVLKEVTRD